MTAVPRASTRLTELLREASGLLVLTGAGVSAESGLATFRGPGGLWEGRDPTELARPEAFRDDPDEVWRFYRWRRLRAAEASPNPAHRALVDLERARGEAFTLVTQNVDGLHERAGSERLVRLHGSLWRLRCERDGSETENLDAGLGETPPRCSCGGRLRPAVVWFGESLPIDALRRAERAARAAELVLVCGTSSVVYPAAALPAIAAEAGAYVVEINPERTSLSDQVDERLSGPAGQLLPALLREAGLALESN